MPQRRADDGEEVIVRLSPSMVGWLLAACVTGAAAAGTLQPEQPTVRKMPPPSPTRIFVADVAIGHIIDGRVYVVDAATGAFIGIVPTGLTGSFIVSPNGRELYVGATYMSRLTRGDKTDLFEIYDLETLKFKQEIVLPTKRSPSLPYRGMLTVSADGRFAYVQNATPATSVTVVDLAARKVASEVATPGCYAIYPASSGGRQFSTLCGDGTVLTVQLDEQGQSVSQKRSAKLFDADADALFTHAELRDGRYHFVSYQGVVHRMNLDGDVAQLEERWSAVSSAQDQREGWRPGGYAPIALSRDGKRLFMGLHRGGTEGSHKTGARQLWVFDLASRKRVSRVAANHEVSWTTTTDAKHELVGVNPEKSLLTVYAGRTPRVVRRMTPVGDVSVQVEAY